MENPLTLMVSTNLLLLSTIAQKAVQKSFLLEEVWKDLSLVGDEAKVSSCGSSLHNESSLSVNKQTIKTVSEVSLNDLLPWLLQLF